MSTAERRAKDASASGDSRVFGTNARIHANLEYNIGCAEGESFVYHSLSVTQHYRVAS